jgi:hypothetical protein
MSTILEQMEARFSKVLDFHIGNLHLPEPPPATQPRHMSATIYKALWDEYNGVVAEYTAGAREKAIRAVLDPGMPVSAGFPARGVQPFMAVEYPERADEAVVGALKVAIAVRERYAELQKEGEGVVPAESLEPLSHLAGVVLAAFKELGYTVAAEKPAEEPVAEEASEPEEPVAEEASEPEKPVVSKRQAKRQRRAERARLAAEKAAKEAEEAPDPVVEEPVEEPAPEPEAPPVDELPAWLSEAPEPEAPPVEEPVEGKSWAEIIADVSGGKSPEPVAEEAPEAPVVDDLPPFLARREPAPAPDALVDPLFDWEEMDLNFDPDPASEEELVEVAAVAPPEVRRYTRADQYPRSYAVLREYLQQLEASGGKKVKFDDLQDLFVDIPAFEIQNPETRAEINNLLGKLVEPNGVRMSARIKNTREAAEQLIEFFEAPID